MLTQHDKDNLIEIKDFLTSKGIEYDKYIDEYDFKNALGESIHSCMPVFRLKNLPNDKKIELRYVNSPDYPLDNSRWGKGYCGTACNFFANLSKKKLQEGWRTIFIKDYEMDEETEFQDLDGTLVTGYRRKWEVLKSSISNACGKIQYRIYARDCEVRPIPAHEAAVFLKKYCFYGPRGATLTLGLYLKKDKSGLKKDTLLLLSSFGMNFYGNKKHKDDPYIEVIRVGTMVNVQVIGGASKLLKHFIDEYPTLTVKRADRDFACPVDKIVYYVDADHGNGQSMKALGYNFRLWDNGGFHNFALEDIDIPKLKVKKGQIFQRKPMIHKAIMQLMKDHKMVSIGTAGTIVYEIQREDYKKKLENHEIFNNTVIE